MQIDRRFVQCPGVRRSRDVRVRAMSLSAPIVDPIEAVAARMETIAAPLQADDGVPAVQRALPRGDPRRGQGIGRATFEDAAFISRLDVVFADLYFAAVDDLDAGRTPSRAWAPLFEARAKRGIAPLQFAIAGMNAHINHDLVLALVATTKELGHSLDRDAPQHRDYTGVGRDPPARFRTRSRSTSRPGSSGRSTTPAAASTTWSPAGASPPRATTRGRRRRSSAGSAPTLPARAVPHRARAQRRLRRPRPADELTAHGAQAFTTSERCSLTLTPST